MAHTCKIGDFCPVPWLTGAGHRPGRPPRMDNVDGAAFAMRTDAGIAAHRARVAADLARMQHQTTRGTPRPVWRLDPDTGTAVRFESIAAATRDTRHKVGGDALKTDWICQTIGRDGTCGGYRWAYVGKEPPGWPAVASR